VKLAEKSGDEALLAHLLDEAEDYKALAKSPPAELKESPEAMAALYHRAGDSEAFDAAVKKVPQGDHAILASLYFFNGQPRKAIEAYGKSGDLVGTVALLSTQGRRKEAMELKAPDDDKLGVGGPLLLEQAVLAHRLGDEEVSKKLVAAAMKTITDHAEKEGKQGSLNDHPLGARLKAGKRMGKFDEAIDDVAEVLDKVKSTSAPSYVLAELGTPRDREALSLVWQFLRDKQKDTNQSETLKLLRGWFVNKKADKDFDDTIASAKKWEGAGKDRAAEWKQALARVYLAVGKDKDAEEIYKGLTQDSKVPADYQRLGDYYFGARRWDEAAGAYEEALKLDPTLAVPAYLRGLALTKIDRTKEGQALIERARLLPLGEESTRFALAEQLGRNGFADEAAQEQLILVRTAPFRSIYASNASVSLGGRAAQKRQYADAARYFRRMATNVALSRSGTFSDTRAYLIVPGRAHQYEALAQIEAGKLDAAQAEAKKLLEYLPEETGVTADLVRALEKADKKDDADKLFEEAYKRLEKATEEAPKFGDAFNRLGWLTARTGRKLKEGLANAKKATELSPKSAVAFDTLAEVYFQSGDKDEALAAIKKAVELAPKVAYYAAQQKRIEAGDKKAELPPR
jgi:tetratricopeptide (TPR) repeat protein